MPQFQLLVPTLFIFHINPQFTIFILNFLQIYMKILTIFFLVLVSTAQTIDNCSIFNQKTQQCAQCEEGYTLTDELVCTKQNTEETTTVTITTDNSEIEEETVVTNKVTATTTTKVLKTQEKILTEQQDKNQDSSSSTRLAVLIYPNCILHQGNICIACEEGYILREGLCIIGIVGCHQLDNFYLPDTNILACKTCDPHFNIDRGICEDIHCQQYSLHTDLCIKCQTGFTFNKFRHVCLDTHCIERNSGRCSRCKLGYYLYPGIDFCIEKNPENCLKYPSTEVCDECPKDHFETIDFKKCVPIIPGCLLQSANDGRCMDCYDGLLLRQNTCVDTKCSIEGYPCQDCKPGYIKYENQICLDPNCNQYNKEVCNKCVTGMKLINGLCRIMPLSCEEIDDQGSCIKCASGFQIVNGKCKIKSLPNCIKRDNSDYSKCISCANQYYVNSEDKCSHVPYLCSNFDSKTLECQQCRDGTDKVNGICTDKNCQITTNDRCSKCKANYVYLSFRRMCVFRDSNCQNFDRQLKCLKCKQNHILSENGLCLIKLTKNCIEYNADKSSCERCSEGYQLKENECIKIPEIIQCQQGFILGSDDQCALITKNCMEYFKGLCSMCERNFILGVDQNCYPQIANCVNYNARECERCGEGYVLGNRNNCFPQIVNCAFYAAEACQKCKDGYALTNDNRCLIQVANCASYTAGACERCGEGYVLDNNNNKCFSQIPNCASYTAGACERCGEGYVLDNSNNKCFSQIPNCASYTAGACERCDEGYVLGNKNNCFPKVVNCASYTEEKCQKCSERYMLGNNNNCFPKVANCASYDAEKCERCEQDYTFGIDGLCAAIKANCKQYFKGECFQCEENYFFIDQKCQQRVSVRIAGCLTQSAQLCVKCLNGLTLENNKCLDKNCESTVEYPCLSPCLEGYELRENICVDPNCVQYDANLCTKCQDGYSKTNNKCKKFPNWCLRVDQNNFCRECLPAYQLSNGSCKIPRCVRSSLEDPSKCQSCARGYFVDEQFRCTKIPYLCKNFNASERKCQICQNSVKLVDGICRDPNCKQSSTDTCIQCNQKYFINEATKICIYNDPYCSIFNEELICTQCQQGWQFNQNKICSEIEKPKECKIGQYLSTLNTCVPIPIIYCLKVDRNDVNKCTQCFEGYHFLTDTGRCQRNPHCIRFSQSGCQQCRFGFNISNTGICYDPNCQTKQNQICTQCKQNHLLDDDRCTYYDPNCQQLGQNACNQCRNGYNKQDNGLCYKLPQYCLISKNFGVDCARCFDNYRLTTEGKCVSKQQVQYCLRYSIENTSICQECLDRYYLERNTCQKVSPACFQYDKNTGVCQRCVNTFDLLANGTCVARFQENDPNCRKYLSGACLQCSNRYYVGIQGKCIPVNPFCRTHDVMGGCTSCYPSYVLQETKCIIIEVSDQYCKESLDQKSCKQCYNGYYPENGSCKPVSPLCKTYNKSNGNCLTCYEGYGIVDGQCKIRYSDLNCKKFENGNCAECGARYYISAGRCAPVDPNCKDYNIQTGQCFECYQGYSVENQFCVISNDQEKYPNCKILNGDFCVECYERFFSDNGVCVEVNPRCNDYDRSNGKCLTCFSGYKVRSNGDCTVETIQEVDQNCKIFKSGKRNECSECYQGYTVINGKCAISTKVNSDPYCLKFQNNECIKCSQGFFINDDKICEQVNPRCRTNDQRGLCTTCYQGYDVFQGDCKLIFTPQPIAQNCQQFDSETKQCLKCFNRYYLASSNECKPVSTLCAAYDSNTGACKSCSSAAFNLQNGKCVQLSVIVEGCSQYVGPYCQKCEDGYNFYNYNCWKIPQQCIFFDENKNICTECEQGYTASGHKCMKNK